MTPIYSDDQPDKADKNPKDGAHQYAVSQKILIRMGKEDALLVRKADMRRYIAEVRDLDDYSSNWIAAAWGLIGIAASLVVAAVTVSGELATFACFAFLCSLGAFGCFVADRQVNQRRRNAGEKIAREMEDGPMDDSEILPLRPDDPPPPPASTS